MNIVLLLIQVIAGAAGGNGVGKVLKNLDMGALWNTVSGALGGGLGGMLLKMLGLGGAVAAGADPEVAGGMPDLGAILGGAGAGAGGGGVLMAIIGIIKNMMAKGGPQ